MDALVFNDSTHGICWCERCVLQDACKFTVVTSVVLSGVAMRELPLTCRGCNARPLWLGTTCYTAGGSNAKETAPLLADPIIDGTPRLRLPLTFKLFDRVLAVGKESFRIMESGSHALSEASRNWLFSSMSLLHRSRGKCNPYADQILQWHVQSQQSKSMAQSWNQNRL